MERPNAVHKMIRGDKLSGKDYEEIRAYIEYLEKVAVMYENLTICYSADKKE